jgi:DNA-binding MurR/RpiR family transcriptional regulator
MSIIQRIQNSAAKLTPAEQKLIESILENPKAAALATAADLAKGVDVHEATASRLARKLGFESYGQFRFSLQDEFIAQQEPAKRLQKSLETKSDGSFLTDLVVRETDALALADQTVSTELIEKAAKTLIDGRKTHIFGRGNAEILSLMMAKRLRRFGKDVQQLSGDMRELAERAHSFEEGDVLLAFAFRRAPQGYLELLEYATEKKLKTIVITGANGAVMAPGADLILTVPRTGGQDEFQTLTVPMTICNAIILAAGDIDQSKSLQKLERLGELIQRFGHQDP